MREEELEPFMDNLEKNLSKVESALEKRGCSEISMATIISFKDVDGFFRTLSSTNGNQNTIEGAMNYWIRKRK